MGKAKNGDKVKVHYTGTLNDGTTFDSSEGREVFQFTIGEGMVIPGFEEAIVGLCVGEEKSITIAPEEAYGYPNPQLVDTIDRKQIPEGIEPAVGMTLQASGPDESVIPVMITAVDDESVTIDANHPLAGETLNFKLRLEQIV